ncbi:hypothetical protein BGAL_0336g00020 [Botrytis galanthina]|uniref:Uncharacterized protein n=1 Tax=Botrytis galanthina TaxID=278940 RepID=A0A4S8QTA7_9HELO|nr:hypothetical protein BGAL_0336g00020 [Botrytis galanthina]
MRTMDAAIVLWGFDVSLISLDRNRTSLLGKSSTYSAPKEKIASIPIFRATLVNGYRIIIEKKREKSRVNSLDVMNVQQNFCFSGGIGRFERDSENGMCVRKFLVKSENTSTPHFIHASLLIQGRLLPLSPSPQEIENRKSKTTKHTYHRNRQTNNDKIRHHITNRKRIMQHIRVNTMGFLHNSTCPVSGEVGAADKEDGEEEGKRPDDDDEDHKPSDDIEAGRGVAGEDAAVEEDEGEFDEAESGDLEELAGPEGLGVERVRMGVWMKGIRGVEVRGGKRLKRVNVRYLNPVSLFESMAPVQDIQAV